MPGFKERLLGVTVTAHPLWLWPVSWPCYARLGQETDLSKYE
ncbi:MAG: hypothetical protein AB1791_13100 [Chloroflexota bacterium]